MASDTGRTPWGHGGGGGVTRPPGAGEKPGADSARGSRIGWPPCPRERARWGLLGRPVFCHCCCVGPALHRSGADRVRAGAGGFPNRGSPRRALAQRPLAVLTSSVLSSLDDAPGFAGTCLRSASCPDPSRHPPPRLAAPLQSRLHRRPVKRFRGGSHSRAELVSCRASAKLTPARVWGSGTGAAAVLAPEGAGELRTRHVIATHFTASGSVRSTRRAPMRVV